MNHQKSQWNQKIRELIRYYRAGESMGLSPNDKGQQGLYSRIKYLLDERSKQFDEVKKDVQTTQ